MIPAIVFVAVSGLLVVFQLALAFGAPWGRFAWGGQHPGVLPVGYRIASAFSVLVYAFLATVIFDRAAVIVLYPEGFSPVAAWVVFAFLALGVLLNLISRSKPERFLMTPVALVLAVLALLVAVLGPS